MKTRMSWSLLKHKFLLTIHPDEETWGINSNVNKNDVHILMLDYDDLPRDFVKQDIKKLQAAYGLGDAELYESSRRHYHAYFFYERLSYLKVIEICYHSNACERFKQARMIYTYITLRLSAGKRGPPQYLELLPGRKKPLHHENRTLRNFVHKKLEVEE